MMVNFAVWQRCDIAPKVSFTLQGADHRLNWCTKFTPKPRLVERFAQLDRVLPALGVRLAACFR
jgi:hypothetical protein